MYKWLLVFRNSEVGTKRLGGVLPKQMARKQCSFLYANTSVVCLVDESLNEVVACRMSVDNTHQLTPPPIHIARIAPQTLSNQYTLLARY